jgi:hypothetical protein
LPKRGGKWYHGNRPGRRIEQQWEPTRRPRPKDGHLTRDGGFASSCDVVASRVKGGRKTARCSPPFFRPLRDWHDAINPSRRSREQFDREQSSMPGDGLPDRCNSRKLVLQFRLNQDRISREVAERSLPKVTKIRYRRLNTQAGFEVIGGNRLRWECRSLDFSPRKE